MDKTTLQDREDERVSQKDAARATEDDDAALNRRTFRWDDPRIVETYRQDGRLMMPAAWRDEDERDDDLIGAESADGAAGAVNPAKYDDSAMNS